MSNKKVLALHFRDSLFAVPTEPALFYDNKRSFSVIKSIAFGVGLLALTIIVSGIWS